MKPLGGRISAQVIQTSHLRRHEHIAEARSALKVAANRQGMDWPQAIWSRWISFEECYGAIEQVTAAQLKVAALSDSLARQLADVSIHRRRRDSMS